MSEQISDQQIIDRVLSGNKNAFNLLVTRYQNRLAYLVSSYVPQSEVPDVVQEAFIKAYRSLASFKGDSLFYTWLYRIAVNTAKNHLIAAGRRPPQHDIDVADSESEEGYYPLTDTDTPENILLSEEIKQTVIDSINALPSDLKEVILLREIEGQSYDDIALAMNIPVGTVRSRLFRAREMIDKKLKDLM